MKPRYSSAAVARARQLRAVNWSISEIPRVLEREGHGHPSQFTVRLWVDPRRHAASQAAVRRAHAHRSAAKSDFTFPSNRTPEWRVGRIKALGGLGLSNEAIAKVMSFDFPDTPVTRHQVAGVFRAGSVPRSIKAAA